MQDAPSCRGYRCVSSLAQAVVREVEARDPVFTYDPALAQLVEAANHIYLVRRAAEDVETEVSAESRGHARQSTRTR